MTQQCRGWTKLDSMHIQVHNHAPNMGHNSTASVKAGEKPENQAITSAFVAMKSPLALVQLLKQFFNFMYLRSSGPNKSSSVVIWDL